MAEHTRAHGGSGMNERTSVGGMRDLELLRSRPLQAREAFIAAYDRLRELARIARRPAVLVAAVDGRARVVEAVLVESGHSLIIGRHTLCGLWLPSEAISLRQLVAYARSESPGAAPVIRLWDLNTERPFLTEDGQPQAAVMAEGTLYAAVGPYALLFVPTSGPSGAPWPTRAELAWRALPPRQFLDRRMPEAIRRQHSRCLRPDGQEYKTNITGLGPLLLLGEDERPEDVWGELRLERGPRMETHRISRERLEQGVLLGRYERCGIPLAELDQISRVHLLLVRMGEEVLAIDTASTNGTWRGRTEIETTVLGERDSLSLGASLRLHWHRLSPGTWDDEA